MSDRESRKNEPTTEARPPAEMHAEIYDDESIAIWPMVMKVWSFRRAFGWAFGGAIGVFLLGLALAYVWYPNQKTAQVGFRLLFDGAEKSLYPNGMPFSPSDVVSTPILEEVYKANNLAQYGGFVGFKNSLYVKQTNIKREILEEDFRAKLADTKLASVDRQRLEREFDAQSNAMVSADFELVFVRKERFREIPATLAYKVLYEILGTYAKDADQKKGALKYRVAIPTRNMVRKDLMDEEDYIVSLDMLRITVLRLQRAVTALQSLPGANVVRVGPTRMALTDVQSNLDDLQQFRISPMIGFVRAIGVTKNAALTIQYLRNQLFTINLDRDAAKGQVQVYENGLRNYLQQRSGLSVAGAGSEARSSGSGGMGNVPALIPQLGDSFFDRLIELGTKGEDTAYRQAMVNKSTDVGMRLVDFEKERSYYEDLISVFEGASKRSNPAVQKQFLDVFHARYPKTFEELMATIDNVNLFYDTLSQQNLNPTSLLVEITVPPWVNTESSLAGRRLLVAAVVYFLVVGVGIVVGIFVFARFRDESRA
jgi:hypothetical protein